MSAQNLLFSSLPVSNLGLYDSTTQTIQTINSDSSGNINLNATGSVNATNLNATNLTAYDITVTNDFTTPNMSLTGTLDVANIVNSNSFQGGTGYFSYGCTAGWSALTNLSSLPTTGTTGQIIFLNGFLYFYNPTNSTYYSISATPLSSPPS
jgi:hypothetical protein